MQYIKKSTLLLQVVLFVPPSLSAQSRMSDHIWVDTIFCLVQETTNTHTDIVYAQHGRRVLFSRYEARRHDDTVKLYLVDVDSLLCKELSLCIPGLARHLQEFRYKGLRCIAFDAKRVFIAYDNRLLRCNYATGRTLKVEKETILEQPFDEMHLLDDSTLVFSHCYPSYAGGASSVLLFTIDIPTLSLQRTITPHYNTPLIAPIKPYKYIDVHGRKILWANRNEYTFFIYNSQLDKESVIKDSELDFLGIPSKKLNSIAQKKLSGADLIEEIKPLIFNHDRLEHAYLINDSNIAIVRVPRKTGQSLTKATLDWWVKDNTTWRRKYTSVEDWAYYEMPFIKPVERNQVQIGWLEGATVLIFNDKIVSITPHGIPTPPIGISKKNYIDARAQWLLHNDTHLQISIISHNFTQ